MRYLIITLLILSSCVLRAQETEPKPEKNTGLFATVNKGDRFRVIRSKERFQVQGKQTSVVTRSTSQVLLEVLEATPEQGRKFRWTLETNKIEAQQDKVFRMVLDKLEELTRGKSFTFIVDAQGANMQLADKPAVMKAYKELTADLDAFMKEKEVQPQLAASVLAGIEAFTREDTVEDVSLRDAKLLFFRPEVLPEEAKPVQRSSSIDNPFGGEPVPSKIVTQIDARNPAMKWLVHEESLDYEAAAPLMRAAIETQALTRGEALPENFELPKIDAVDRFAIQGFEKLPPAQLVHEYIVMRDGMGRHDRDRFTVTPVSADEMKSQDETEGKPDELEK